MAMKTCSKLAALQSSGDRYRGTHHGSLWAHMPGTAAYMRTCPHTTPLHASLAITPAVIKAVNSLHVATGTM